MIQLTEKKAACSEDIEALELTNKTVYVYMGSGRKLPCQLDTPEAAEKFYENLRDITSGEFRIAAIHCQTNLQNYIQDD